MNLLRRTFAAAGCAAFLLPAAACSDGPSGPGERPGGNGPNLRIETLYVVQSIQDRSGTVPLVAGRDGYLRVFAVADRANTATPSVRVRLYHGETLRETWTIPAPGASVPTQVDQANLASSWNVRVPAELIRPGMRIRAEVDPDGAFAESNESDNAFPAGGPLAMNVLDVPPLRIRFVPIRTPDGLQGNVTEQNKDDFLTLTRKIHPVSRFETDVRAPYNATAPFDREGVAWSRVVSELDAVRVAEGSNHYYYGVVRAPYNGGGVVGIAAGIGSRTSLGWDLFPSAPETLAHELGHNWGRFHAPCAGAAGTDPNWPTGYLLGMIGVYGLDVETGQLKTPTAFTDIMGYCDASWWISDYTFKGVLDHRIRFDGPAASAAAAQPSLLVWGRIEEGEVVLEPAFQVTTRPSLPAAQGPYRVEGLDASGSTVFSVAFSAEPIPDVAGDRRHFAFAVPLAPEQAGRLQTLRVVGRGKVAAQARAAAAPGGARASLAPAPRVRVGRQGADRLSVRWDAAAHPMAMIRDPRTGEILALARGGSAELRTGGTEVEVVLSDGVGSAARRVGAGAP